VEFLNDYLTVNFSLFEPSHVLSHSAFKKKQKDVKQITDIDEINVKSIFDQYLSNFINLCQRFSF